MNRLFLLNVQLNGSPVNISVENNRFASISQSAPQIPPDAQIIDAHGKLAVLPPFYNTHTHAAMALLRGYADDLALFDWLNNYIWPVEARLTPEIDYAGVRLAILEMIKSGTVFFNDMYWCARQTVRAAEEMGVRACVGILRQAMSADFAALLDNSWLLENHKSFSSRIQLSYAPHAIYTAKEEFLRESAQCAKEKNFFLHIHLAETQKEFDDCIREHGTTPAQYLDQCGMLTPYTTLAHSIFLTDEDIQLIAERQSVISHNTVSNMKLASGHFRYDSAPLLNRCRITLGTDGASSNNATSMFTEMKTTAIRAKDLMGQPADMPAAKVWDMATRAGADAFRLDAGEIAVGKLADCMLVNLDDPRLVPGYHLISDLVYAADSAVVDTVICDGRILMRERHVSGEEEIISEARRAARLLTASR